MTVTELRNKLNEHIAEGRGDFDLFDSNAYPIIGTSTSDDDLENELKRVYIEAEF